MSVTSIIIVQTGKILSMVHNHMDSNALKLGKNIFSLTFKLPTNVLIWNGTDQCSKTHSWTSIFPSAFFPAKTNGHVCGHISIYFPMKPFLITLFNSDFSLCWLPMVLIVQNMLAYLIYFCIAVSPQSRVHIALLTHLLYS